MSAMNPGSRIKRSDRVAGQVHEALSGLLLRGMVRDPGVRGVVVSDVRLSDDLRNARVYVRLLEEASPEQRERVIDALTRATGHIRRAVGSELQLRRVPDLKFYWDELIDDALRMEALIDDVAAEDEKSNQEYPG